MNLVRRLAIATIAATILPRLLLLGIAILEASEGKTSTDSTPAKTGADRCQRSRRRPRLDRRRRLVGQAGDGHASRGRMGLPDRRNAHPSRSRTSRT